MPAPKTTAKKPARKTPAKKTPAKKVVVKKAASFALTYATMFNPPEEMHLKYEKALANVKAGLGRDYPMFINGQDRFTAEKFEDRSPINTEWVLGTFQKGGVQDAQDALAAAHAAFPKWAGLKWQDRVRLLRKAAALIEKRVYEIGVALSLEVGKNRMEGLGDAQETADMIYYSCDTMERNGGFIKEMGRDPLAGFNATNISILRPYGVWAVISPWNFPFALSGGPSGAALVAGNTVVLKTATDTPWTGRLLAECMRDAGLPAGVFNYVTGPGSTVGQTLIDDPRVGGITFTGSWEVGMHIYRTFAQGRYPRPVIAEMGGKNPSIVSRNANLEDAATGIVRAAFGLQGQKCSANSRIFVANAVKDKLLGKILDKMRALKIGDPTERANWLGPVAHAAQYRDYGNYCEELSQAGTILAGGHQITGERDGLDYSKGYYCEPTLVDAVPADHKLWQQEMFLPITMIEGFDDLEHALRRANDVAYGLTAGFYGSKKEAALFFNQIEAGVTYANRPQGSTTGAWPGFQPFGGWKGSGSSGKNAGGLYYLPLFMHEQIQTTIERA
ncbi:MAG: aldehyde dehydrogenase family protein [Anaerolineales bacterium]|nr:aldehyde dehydrogenase family protein [Anaerolineales bacterium]